MKSLLQKIEAAHKEAEDLCAAGEQIEAIRNGLKSLHEALAERAKTVPAPAPTAAPAAKAAPQKKQSPAAQSA
jgi:hypothetical protein